MKQVSILLLIKSFLILLMMVDTVIRSTGLMKVMDIIHLVFAFNIYYRLAVVAVQTANASIVLGLY